MHHEFQPFPIEEIEFNPFGKFKSDWGVIVVPDRENKRINARTIKWCMAGFMFDLYSAIFCLPSSAYTSELLLKEDYFSLNFFNMEEKGIKNALRFLEMTTGRKEDKIKEIGFHIDADGDTPYIDESNFVMICKPIYNLPIPVEGIRDEKLKKYLTEENMSVTYLAEVTKVFAR